MFTTSVKGRVDNVIVVAENDGKVTSGVWFAPHCVWDVFARKMDGNLVMNVVHYLVPNVAIPGS